MVDVWQRRKDESKPRHIGSATINLTSLALPQRSSGVGGVGGLEYVYGWYDITHGPTNRSRGQLLLGVYPVAPGEEEDGQARRLSPRLEKLMTAATPNRAPSPSSATATPAIPTTMPIETDHAQVNPTTR